MEHIIYVIAVVVYGIFIIRFILSWVGGDFDLDTDADLDLGDLVSFKGLTHFLMGSSGWLSLKCMTTHAIEWYDWLIAFILGLIFVVTLFFIYKFMLKLESKPIIKTGKDLVGVSGSIYIIRYFDTTTNLYNYMVTVPNGLGTTEVLGNSSKKFKVGDSVILSDFNGVYYTLI